MLLVILFYGILGYFAILLVNKHQNRIDKELKRGIVDKNKIKKNKIGDKNIIIEFSAPKGLSPIEVGYLYDMKIGKEDIVCLIYKRMEMKIVEVSYNYKGLKVTKVGSISDKKVPQYETDFWNMFFEKKEEVIFPNDLLYNDLGIFKDKVKDYCIQKGWIKKKEVYFSLEDFFKTILPWKTPSRDISYIPFGRLSGFFIGIVMMVIGAIILIRGLTVYDVFPIWKLILVVALMLGGLWTTFAFVITLYETQDKHIITLTEKGQGVVAEIYGYKKFLETCEEKQLKEFMRDDPLYLDKILPYAVALGLENIISDKLPKKLSTKEGSLADLLHFEKVI